MKKPTAPAIHLDRNRVSSHRYLIYKMIGRMVTFTFAGRKHKKRVSGYVDDVYRDIFTGEIEISIRNHRYRFKEPVVIRMDGLDIVFLYGDVGQDDVPDDTLFSEMRSNQLHETMSETISRITPTRVKEIRFTLGEKKTTRRRPALMRGIEASVPS